MTLVTKATMNLPLDQKMIPTQNSTVNNSDEESGTIIDNDDSSDSDSDSDNDYRRTPMLTLIWCEQF